MAAPHQFHLLLYTIYVLGYHQARYRVALVHQLTLGQKCLVVSAYVAVYVALQQVLLLQVIQRVGLSQRLRRTFLQQRLVDAGIRRKQIARWHFIHLFRLVHLGDTLAEGVEVLLFESPDGPDGIDIRQTTIVVP